jgi:hypothetical protein
MLGKQAPSQELLEKVLFIKDYFTKHPKRTPVNINRVYSDPVLNRKEVNALYAIIKKDTANEHAFESAIISHVLSEEKNAQYPVTRSDEEMKIFFTTVQWLGSNVGSEIVEAVNE